MNDRPIISWGEDSEAQWVDPTRPNWMEIDLDALEHNFRRVQQMVGPEVQVIPCVKNEAFGLGLCEVSRRLAGLGAGTIFCGSYQDAKTLRDAGLDKTELIAFGSTLPAGIPSYLKIGLIPTVHNMEIADAVSHHATRSTRIYVKVDTGRGRLGFPIRAADEAILQIARRANVIVAGVYTHLPFKDADGARWAQERTEQFDELIDRLRRKGLDVPVTQARSSSGVLFGLRDRCNAVAPGSILYGKSSLADEVIDSTGFQPVLSAIRTRLIHVSPDATDQTPGMFGRDAPRRVLATGVIPFGRKDGYRPAGSGQTSFVIVNGARAPILSVSSEQAVIDLSGARDPKVGDDVVIVGRSGELEVTLADLAQWQDISVNDVLLMLRGRTPQVFNRPAR